MLTFTDILIGKYSPVILIIILLLSFKEWENMAPSCKFKSPVWEHFDFLITILLLFYVCRWKNIQIYIMSTCFGCEIQTVYSCLNRSEITENWHQKLKHNRKKSVQPWQPFNWLLCYQNMLTSLFLRNK